MNLSSQKHGISIHDPWAPLELILTAPSPIPIPAVHIAFRRSRGPSQAAGSWDLGVQLYMNHDMYYEIYTMVPKHSDTILPTGSTQAPQGHGRNTRQAARQQLLRNPKQVVRVT